MDILDQFADDVTEININFKNIVGSLNFERFTKLKILYCTNNFITSLENLPNSLIELDCDSNEITSLDNLPNSLIELCCYDNQITILDNLPKSLTKLYCDDTIKNYNNLI